MSEHAPSRPSRRRWRRAAWLVGIGLVLTLLIAVAVLAVQGLRARSTLAEAVPTVDRLEQRIRDGDAAGAADLLGPLQRMTASARDDTSGFLWRLASRLPWAGPNVDAVATTVGAVDDVTHDVLPPLVQAAGVLDWSSLRPVDGRIDLAPLEAAAPLVTGSQESLTAISATMDGIDTGRLVGQVAAPVAQVRDGLGELSEAVRSGARAARLLPPMLGADEPRTYLLLFQNNAELRATGGIPGAASLVSVDRGRIQLAGQVAASDVGPFETPVAPLDPAEQAVYSDRMGRFFQDVNLTPDFPTAASLAATMWEWEHGTAIDGVFATDPVALSYLLESTGPLDLPGGLGLDAGNAVAMLLSEVYERFERPADQDLFFAATAARVFEALVSGGVDAGSMVDQLDRAAAEHRLLAWSARPDEQAEISQTVLSGQFDDVRPGRTTLGVFLNDGTGAKMSYYLEPTVRAAGSRCEDATRFDTVALTLTSTAPADAADVLPRYVTGAGSSDLPAGSVRTNVAFYGAVAGEIVSVRRDGTPVGSTSHLIDRRPVALFTVDLAPGETVELEIEVAQPRTGSAVDIWVTPTVRAVEQPAAAPPCR